MDPFDIDGVRFVSSHGASTADQFCIRKSQPLVDATIGLVERVKPARLVEFGIASGGSTALLALTAPECRIVAIEYDTEPVVPLADLIAARGLDVHPHYGVDQGDRARVVSAVDDAFGGAPIDIVIDDASHRYVESLASFEVLFPRLRPGGVYVIEDWNWQLRFTYSIAHPSGGPAKVDADDAQRVREYVRANARPVPLEQLALQLVLAQACATGVIEHLVIDELWVAITRGTAPLDRDGFRLGDLFVDPHGLVENP
jgi:predicted O-methyltransferase YrrM